MSDLISNVLVNQFDYSVNQCSPVADSYVRVVNRDEKGNEYITYVPFDSAAYQKSLGPVDNWSLANLVKAGIDPSFAIHTGNPTRLEGDAFVRDAEKVVESLIQDSPASENVE